MQTKSILEELYAPPEIQDAFNCGRGYERKNHECKKKVKVEVLKVFSTRHEHPRSQWKKYGIISNSQLLNGTYDTLQEAGLALAGLVPASRPNSKPNGEIIKLF